MTNAPKTVGLVHNGFGGWRLWTTDDADDPTVFPVPYILAAEQERLTAGRDAEIARLRDALSKSVAAANLRDTYNQLPPDRNRIGDKKSPRSRARDIWMKALRKAEVSARAALEGDSDE